MSIRNVFNRNLDFKSLWITFLRQRNRQFISQCIKCLPIANGQNVYNTQVLCKSLFSFRNKIQPWKLMLAISLVYAGYDRESESIDNISIS